MPTNSLLLGFRAVKTMPVLLDGRQAGHMSTLARLEPRSRPLKKGRHRRYEEARKFQRENAAASFSVENFDFEADPWPSQDKEEDDESPDDASDNDDDDDDYADLAAKYADFDTTQAGDSAENTD